MGIRSQKTEEYWAACNGCEVEIDGPSTRCEGSAVEQAEDEGWRWDGERALCPECQGVEKLPNPAPTPEFCWSTNEESFYGCCASREEAMAEGREDAVEHCDQDVYWTGRVVPPAETIRGMALWIGENALEMVNERYYDECGGEDDYAVVLNDGITTKDLGSMIVEWLLQNAEITRYSVVDVQEHEVDPDESMPEEIG